MQLSWSKSKNSTSYYITKSFRDPKTKKVTSRVVRKLGTEAELRERLGGDADIVAWGRALAREMTEAEKAGALVERIELDPSKRIAQEDRRLFCAGNLFDEHPAANLRLRLISTVN